MRQHNFACTPVIKDEILTAKKEKMKLGKATDPEKISVEHLEVLEDYGIDKNTTLVNKIYETPQIPQDISKSTFIALPKKPVATKFEVQSVF